VHTYTHTESALREHLAWSSATCNSWQIGITTCTTNGDGQRYFCPSPFSGVVVQKLKFFHKTNQERVHWCVIWYLFVDRLNQLNKLRKNHIIIYSEALLKSRFRNFRLTPQQNRDFTTNFVETDRGIFVRLHSQALWCKNWSCFTKLTRSEQIDV